MLSGNLRFGFSLLHLLERRRFRLLLTTVEVSIGDTLDVGIKFSLLVVCCLLEDLLGCFCSGKGFRLLRFRTSFPDLGIRLGTVLVKCCLLDEV